MATPRTAEGGEKSPPMRGERDGMKRKSFTMTEDGEDGLDNKPIGADSSSRSTARKKGGDAARKAQKWGGGSKGSKESRK